jgi:dihydroorotate dehydrogenase
MIFNLFHRSLLHLPPENAHNLALAIAKFFPSLGQASGIVPDHKHQVRIGSLVWTSPIGLAAGLDKNAEAIDFFSAQGFGAIECGTVTLKPQYGNPKPRIFRYTHEKSLRNSMGFPSKGFQVVKEELIKVKKTIPLGLNLGKNKDSTADQSILELSLMAKESCDLIDYFVINVSSPNTPGLRELQTPQYLKNLIVEIKKSIEGKSKDLYIKISPDLERDQLIALTEFAQEIKVTGLIATNTTINLNYGPGGISGKLLKEKALLAQNTLLSMRPSLEIIGVGGFESFEDILKFWNKGGKGVQIYTSYIYQGPQILHSAYQDISHFLSLHKLSSLDCFFNLSLIERQELIKESLHENSF